MTDQNINDKMSYFRQLQTYHLSQMHFLRFLKLNSTWGTLKKIKKRIQICF